MSLMSENSQLPAVLFEDDDLLAVAKPAGMVVNDALSASGLTLQQWMTGQKAIGTGTQQDPRHWQSLVPADFDDRYGSPEALFADRAGMVHRLDKDTSGVIVWAKNPGAQVELLRQFREREVEKEYVCLVHGKLESNGVAHSHDSEFQGQQAGVENSGWLTVDAPIERSTENRQRFAVRIGGRPAVTRYRSNMHYRLDFERFVSAARAARLFAGRPAAQLKQQLSDYLDYTLVACQPRTGRTHQIRVHMSHLGFPLAGDQLYQGRKRIKMDEVWCPRHFLHAATLRLSHPRTKERVTFTAPLPPELHATLDWLQAVSDA